VDQPYFPRERLKSFFRLKFGSRGRALLVEFNLDGRRVLSVRLRLAFTPALTLNRIDPANRACATRPVYENEAQWLAFVDWIFWDS
jgi:hypothetical protein